MTTEQYAAELVERIENGPVQLLDFNPWLKPKPRSPGVSPETRRRMSRSHIGLSHPVSPETRRRMAASHKGKCHTPETRQKMRKPHKPRTLSKEHIERGTASRKRSHFRKVCPIRMMEQQPDSVLEE